LDFYRDEANREKFFGPEKRKFRLIQLPAKLDSGEDGIAKAKALADELQATPADFANKASEHSIGVGKDDGGSYGDWIKKDDIAPFLADVVFQLEVGKVSKVITSPAGYFIVKVDGIQPEVAKSFEDAQPEIQRHFQLLKYREEKTKLLKAIKARGLVIPFDPSPEAMMNFFQ
ncbi:MAG: peptidyl-prolyl cis-trans isomerase, partial [Planctomycetota bacterium]|nr:peptidyl-prolyl cis-trans isomerase [Planctomycetota bacterium]